MFVYITNQDFGTMLKCMMNLQIFGAIDNAENGLPIARGLYCISIAVFQLWTDCNFRYVCVS